MLWFAVMWIMWFVILKHRSSLCTNSSILLKSHKQFQSPFIVNQTNERYVVKCSAIIWFVSLVLYVCIFQHLLRTQILLI
jgi:hypothetical protein